MSVRSDSKAKITSVSPQRWSHHELGSPAGGLSSVHVCPIHPQSSGSTPSLLPEMPRDRLEGVCRISAWQLWESKATIKFRPKQDYLHVMLSISDIRVNCIKVWIQLWTISILKI